MGDELSPLGGGSREAAEIEAVLALKGIPRLGDRGIWRGIQQWGSAVAAWRALGAQRSLFREGDPAALRTRWERQGLTLIPITSPHYPSSLKDLDDPPPLLFLRGREELLRGPSVAVVGTRAPTEVGRRAAETVGRLLGAAGVVVASGMARGIDSAAHWGALGVGGATLAVLGSGLGIRPAHGQGRLAEAISRSGLLVSEFTPLEPPLRHHFPKRNRILAALARAVVVVEAGDKSGALITVDHALQLGRDVYALPGSVENPRARGSNLLLRDGAGVIPFPEAVLEALEPLVREARVRKRERAGEGTDPDPRGGEGEGSGDGKRPSQGTLDPSAPPRDLPPALLALWDALGDEPRTVDEVALRSRSSPREVLAGLAALEMGGWVKACPGLRFRRGHGIPGGDS